MVDISVARLVVDFILLVACGIPLLLFQLYIQPYKRGFYCNDDSLRYPYLDSTITRHTLIVIGLVVPSILIILTEVFRTLAWERKLEKSSFPSYRIRKYSVHRLVVRLYIFLGYYMLGVCFNQLMVDIAKYTIGRQRPHFIAICIPKRGERDFRDCSTFANEYITDFNCTGKDAYRVRESMLSFYSGHASFSWYAAWFMALYLQARLYQPLYSRILLPIMQFILFGFAAYVSYTRVSDYKHHWSDVLVGATIGSTIGIFTALFIAEVFQRREIPGLPKPAFEDTSINGDDRNLVRRDRDLEGALEPGMTAARTRPNEKSAHPAQVEMTTHSISPQERMPSRPAPVFNENPRV